MNMKFSHIQQIFFFSILVGATGIFFWMIGSYLFPVLWAAIVAIVFYPMHTRISRLCRHRHSIAALLTIFTISVLVLTPLIILGGMIVQDSIELYQRIGQDQTFDSSSLFGRAEQAIAYLEPFGIEQAAVMERVQEWTATITQTISSSLLAFSQMTLTLLVYIGIMLYLLFFFFRDGVSILHTLADYIPLKKTDLDRLFTRFSKTTQAVVKGTLTIAVLQGCIIGITFWLTGVTSPVLWGMAVAILAIIPAVGPALIWLPAGIILIATGSIWGGVIVFVVGAILVALVDEFLRPIMVGRGSNLPDPIILLATIGGLASFGISGFVLGPIIAAFFLSLWTMFGERYQTERSAK